MVYFQYFLFQIKYFYAFHFVGDHHNVGETKKCEMIHDSCLCISYNYPGPSSLIYLTTDFKEYNNTSCAFILDEKLNQVI